MSLRRMNAVVGMVASFLAAASQWPQPSAAQVSPRDSAAGQVADRDIVARATLLGYSRVDKTKTRVLVALTNVDSGNAITGLVDPDEWQLLVDGECTGKARVLSVSEVSEQVAIQLLVDISGSMSSVRAELATQAISFLNQPREAELGLRLFAVGASDVKPLFQPTPTPQVVMDAVLYADLGILTALNQSVSDAVSSLAADQRIQDHIKAVLVATDGVDTTEAFNALWNRELDGGTKGSSDWRRVARDNGILVHGIALGEYQDIDAVMRLSVGGLAHQMELSSLADGAAQIRTGLERHYSVVYDCQGVHDLKLIEVAMGTGVAVGIGRPRIHEEEPRDPIVVTFPTGAAKLADMDKVRDELTELADYLARHPDVHVVLEGHASTPGDADTLNEPLSLNRAVWFAELLRRRLGSGICSRLHIRAWGESRPVYPDDAVPERQRANQRVVVRFVEAGAPRETGALSPECPADLSFLRYWPHVAR